jgi:chitinase
VGTVSATSYTHTNLKPNTKYSYRVSALDNAGKEGEKSATVTAATPAPAAPAAFKAPTGVRATANKGLTVTVSWQAVSGATKYKVYWEKGASQTLLNTVSGTSYTHAKLTPNTKYSYSVSAVDNAGRNEGAKSAPVAATTPAK